MLKAALIIPATVLLALGGEGLSHFVANRQQSTFTCQQFAEAPPSAIWLRVTGCEIDAAAAGYREADGLIEELYLPARPERSARTQPVTLVAATRDAAVLTIAQAAIGGGRQHDQQQYLAAMQKIIAALRATNEVEGLARGSILERFRTPRLLSGLPINVAPGAVIVDLHARPAAMFSAIEFGTGVILLAGALLIAWREKRSGYPTTHPQPIAPAPSPSDEPASAHRLATEWLEIPAEHPITQSSRMPAPPPPSGGLPRVMLLNLDPSAGVDAIEQAPPLGSKAEAMASIVRAIPDLEFDERGRAAMRQADYSITIDVGINDPVHTAIVEASGARGARLLGRVLQSTGWRAFAPKLGDFISPEALGGAGAPDPAAIS